MTGKELFPEKKLKLADGKTYKLSFSFYSLRMLEDECGGKFVNVFDIFGEKEEDFTAKTVEMLLWACLLEHQDEFEELSGRKITRAMGKLVDGENFREVLQITGELFKSYWRKENEEDERKKK
jgi:hypothetical protein